MNTHLLLLDTALQAIGKGTSRRFSRQTLRGLTRGKPILQQNKRSLFHSPAANMATSDWNAAQYLKFESERTRPSRDLLAQVRLTSGKRIVDLGCGPGNSTAVLAERYPDSRLTGIDSSPDMIKKAKATLPNIEFTLANLSSYTSDEPVDLFFSNAVLQWLPHSERIEIITRLLQSQPSGGVFAFQVPDNLQEPSHMAMRETAAQGPWSATLGHLTPARDPSQSPQELYNQLRPLCSSVNIWHTHYYHILEDHHAIVEWLKATGLKPFIDPLPQEDRDGFLNAYLNRIRESYPILQDGKVMLRFPRLFVVAVRQ
jgi:trans-aconitate 2-methyltransferase